eukprot:1345279-Prymnesium_polylepis.3
MPLCSGMQPGASWGPSERCCGLARRLAHASRALVCMGLTTLYETCAAGMWTSAACHACGFRASQWP